MKNHLLLVFLLITCLSFVACSNTQNANTLDKSNADNYIGVWTSDHMCFTVSKGGLGRYEQPGTDIGFFDFEWEINDELLIIYINGQVSEYKASFELNDEGTALTIQFNGLPGYTVGENTFFKQ